MHHHSDQVIKPLGIGGISGGVKEAELQREDHTVAKLSVALKLLHVFESLQVQGEDHGKFFNPHSKDTHKYIHVWTI